MLIFAAIIFVTGLTASFAAEPNGNLKCIEKCVNSTACAPSQNHLQNCSVKERYEKCISTCNKTNNISNTENLKKRFLNEHKNNNTINSTGLVQINSTNPRNLNKQKLNIYEKLAKNVGNLLTLMNSKYNNETTDDHGNRYIIKEIVDAIKNRIKHGLNKLVDILDILSTNSTDDNNFKANTSDSSNENKLKVMVHLLEALKKLNDGHLPEAENRKVKREITLSNIGKNMGGYVGAKIGRAVATRRMGKNGVAGKIYGKVGAIAGKSMGERMGRKMGERVANFPSQALNKLGVFSSAQTNPQMQKFCCVQC